MAASARVIQAGDMGQPFVVVDAFTDRPFAGNPGAVCVLPGPADERWMRAVASEMNLSETAFLHPEGDGYRLRWFTPTVEINLCGHGTLASAHALWESERVPPQTQIRFATRSGLLSARRDGAFIELDFPASSVVPCPPPPGLAAALGAEPRWVGQNDRAYLVELPSEAAVRALDPDFRALAALPLRVVTAKSSPEILRPRSGRRRSPYSRAPELAFWAERVGGRARIRLQSWT